MGRNMYIGVKDTAKRVKKIYIGVGDKAKKVLKGYIGVDGKAKLFFSSECETHNWVYPMDGTIHGTCQECDFKCTSTQMTTSYDSQTATTHRHIDICEQCEGAAVYEGEPHSWRYPENGLGHGICECDYTCESTQLTSSYVEKTSTGHRRLVICDTCSGRVEDVWNSHSFENGKCTECDYVCQHEWNDGVCNICTYKCSHEYISGVCQLCADVCEHPTWNDGVCTQCGYECQHDDTYTDTSEPGCTNAGSYTVTCNTCGLTVGGGSIDPTGHPEDSVHSVSEYPNGECCQGNVVYTCDACGESWLGEGEADPSQDHDYSVEDENGKVTCSICGGDAPTN